MNQLPPTQEIARYVADEKVVDWEDCSLLEWWNRSKHRYPHLAKLAMNYLSIPATSVPSERAFSTVGHIVNEKRAYLLPENVSMVFWHQIYNRQFKISSII